MDVIRVVPLRELMTLELQAGRARLQIGLHFHGTRLFDPARPSITMRTWPCVTLDSQIQDTNLIPFFNEWLDPYFEPLTVSLQADRVRDSLALILERAEVWRRDVLRIVEQEGLDPEEVGQNGNDEVWRRAVQPNLEADPLFELGLCEASLALSHNAWGKWEWRR